VAFKGLILDLPRIHELEEELAAEREELKKWRSWKYVPTGTPTGETPFVPRGSAFAARGARGGAIPKMPLLEPSGGGGGLAAGSSTAGEDEGSSSTAPAGGSLSNDQGRVRLSQIRATSTKVIRTKLSPSSDIVTFLDKITQLENAIEEIYSNETEKVKIQIALQNFSDALRTEGDLVYDGCKSSGFFHLKSFLKEVFSYSFPAPESTLISAFEGISQNHPTKGNITDYARRFRAIISMLKYDLEGFRTKFVDGLANSELKSALRRNNWEGLTFTELVRLAVSIENNLSRERPAAKAYVVRGGGERLEGEGSGVDHGVGERDWDLGASGGYDSGEDDERAQLIMGVPIAKYFQAADRQNVSNRCFNCFNKHKSTLCPIKYCKFCERKNSLVKHYSLLCPKAPKNFEKFLEAREKVRKEKKETVRYANDFVDYDFSSDEFEGE